jgi:hypothetical protein
MYVLRFGSSALATCMVIVDAPDVRFNLKIFLKKDLTNAIGLTPK